MAGELESGKTMLLLTFSLMVQPQKTDPCTKEKLGVQGFT
jgi:hypothetical protein